MLFFLWGRGLAWSKIRGSGPRGPRFKSGRPHQYGFIGLPLLYVYAGVIWVGFLVYFRFLEVFSVLLVVGVIVSSFLWNALCAKILG